MRTLWLGCTLTAVALAIASCSFPADKPVASCATDESMCPKSSKAATSVTCDCHCNVGLDEETGEAYDGHVAVCLPPDLNTTLAAGEVRTGLSALDARVFDQRVYQYCSQDVARFLRTAIVAPIGIRSCVVPVDCECTTKGALRDSDACHTDCEDVTCTTQNCRVVLWRPSKIDASECRCSRATACGSTEPVAERHGVCRDWLTPPDVDDDAGSVIQ